MNNGYYIHTSICKDGKLLYPGVAAKIQYQSREFSEYGNIDEIVLEEDGSTWGKVKKRLPFYKKSYGWEECLKKIKSPNYIYIRKPMFDRGIISFLKSIRTKNPDCKILIELFTYPYDRDQFLNKENLISRFPCYVKDVLNRNRIHAYVDALVTYSDDEKIWGIPTIRIFNGVDVAMLPATKKVLGDTEEIHIISVATMQEHHGYDRFLRGMEEYYRRSVIDKKIIYHVVGEGPKYNEYVSFVKSHQLEKVVIFEGSLMGKELDFVYDKADIAVASLGMHRLGLKTASTLKTREYLARGIPFIYAGEIDVFKNNNVDFALQFPANNNPIELDRLIEFYENLKAQNEDNLLSQRIKNFAYKTVDMHQAFKPVIDFIQE